MIGPRSILPSTIASGQSNRPGLPGSSVLRSDGPISSAGQKFHLDGRLKARLDGAERDNAGLRDPGVECANEAKAAAAAVIEAIGEGKPIECRKVEHGGDGLDIGVTHRDLAASAVLDLIDLE